MSTSLFSAAVPGSPPSGGVVCESCGQRADVMLRDGSTWCWSCHGSALKLGYDSDTGSPVSDAGGEGSSWSPAARVGSEAS